MTSPGRGPASTEMPVWSPTDADRQVYALLADELIPSAEGMPSASQAGVATTWIDEALRFRPDLASLLRDALGLARVADPKEVLAALNDEHPRAFEALGTLTAGAYFLNPEIMRLVGYPGQIAIPIRDDIDSYSDMLERVVDRGDIYRDVSKAGFAGG